MTEEEEIFNQVRCVGFVKNSLKMMMKKLEIIAT